MSTERKAQMNVRRFATLTVATGVLVSGLSAASATATAAPPKEKCDPSSGVRVERSESGRDKVDARGCVEIHQREDGRWEVTGTVYAKAYTNRGSGDWRLAAHRYAQSCETSSRRAAGGSHIAADNNQASTSDDGTTENRCLETTLAPGTYVFEWSYDRKAGRPGSAVHNEGQVTFTIPGNGLSDLIVRPMPHIR